MAIVIAPARTGNDGSGKITVSNVARTNNGIRSKVIPFGRISEIVEILSECLSSLDDDPSSNEQKGEVACIRVVVFTARR